MELEVGEGNKKKNILKNLIRNIGFKKCSQFPTKFTE